MSNRDLIKRLRSQYVMSKYLSSNDLYPGMVDAMEKAALALEAQEWRTDMENAPQDIPIDVWNGRGGFRCAAVAWERFNRKDWAWASKSGEYMCHPDHATHWKPITPPE